MQFFVDSLVVLYGGYQALIFLLKLFLIFLELIDVLLVYPMKHCLL